MKERRKALQGRGSSCLYPKMGEVKRGRNSTELKTGSHAAHTPSSHKHAKRTLDILVNIVYTCSEKETMTVGIKQRRERERQATQQATLQAALEIASEEGWQAVTIRRVAERIEYSPSAIYKYFEDKEAILHTLLLQGFQQMVVVLERVATQEHRPSERLQQMAAV